MNLEAKRLQLFFFLEVLYYLEHLLTIYTDTVNKMITPIINNISAIQTLTAMNTQTPQSVQDGTHVEIKPSQDLPKVPQSINIIVEYLFYALVALFITAITTATIFGIAALSKYLFS